MWLVPQPSERQMEFLVNHFQIPADEVLHFDVFQVSPGPLDGVQVRSVRGKEFKTDSLPRRLATCCRTASRRWIGDRSQITSQRSS